MSAPDYRLGIDVGGTNTDAVIMDAADRVIAKAKVPCTPDITGGITAAIDAVLKCAGGHPRPDQPCHARHHPRDQRRAGAPEPATGGGDQNWRPGHPQRQADVRVAARPGRGGLGRRGDRGWRHRVRRP